MTSIIAIAIDHEHPDSDGLLPILDTRQKKNQKQI